MKWLISLTSLTGFVLVATLMLAGCATSGNGIGSGSTPRIGNSAVAIDNPSLDLTDYLRRIPGVFVSGNGPTARITIRGVSTFIGSTDPLFVVNGIRLGRNFRDVYTQVNMYDVSSVEVLKGPEASTYGVQGGNGVVIIHY